MLFNIIYPANLSKFLLLDFYNLFTNYNYTFLLFYGKNIFFYIELVLFYYKSYLQNIFL